ncbi:MAG: hypothetical protein ACHQ1D_01295 [Nitrososphaerales archaeon]
MTDQKFIISVEETAVYEIWAENKEEAQELFENGGGDFLGWDEQKGRELLIERFDDGLTNVR